MHAHRPHWRTLPALLLLALGYAGAANAATLGGDWEVQTMGSDREISIEQAGNEIAAHRVMWPEFEGEKYKLEHLYRGTLIGNRIRGKLYVKEPELKDFEALRDFTGEITGDSIVLDGLPMKRKNPPPPAAVATAPAPSKGTTATASASAPPPPPATAEAEDPGTNLFDSIMGSPGGASVFRVSSSMSLGGPAQELREDGDRLFKGRKYAEALAKYQEAAKASSGQQVDLLHRQGQCLLELNRRGEAKGVLRRALKLDPNNEALKADYKRAK